MSEEKPSNTKMNKEIEVGVTGKLNNAGNPIYYFLSEKDRDRAVKLGTPPAPGAMVAWAADGPNGLPSFSENYARKAGFWEFLVIVDDSHDTTEVIPNSGMYWVRDGDPVDGYHVKGTQDTDDILR